MSTVRQLFHLQELDLQIVREASQVSSLETRIGDRRVVVEAEVACRRPKSATANCRWIMLRAS